MVRKIQFLRLHRLLEKKEPEGSLRGGEDYVEFVLAELAPDCQRRFKDRAEEGQSAPLREERRGEAKIG